MTTHLDDAALLALLDEDPDEVVDPAVARHLVVCEECRARQALIRRRSEELALWFARDAALPEPDHAPHTAHGPVRTRRWAPSLRLRIAAGIVIVVGALGLGPLRAMVIGWIRPSAGEGTEAGAPPVLTDTDFAFDAPGRDFEIRIVGEAVAGRLEILVDREPRGRVFLRGVGPGAGVVLGAGRLDVDPAAGAGFEVVVEVTLPAHVTHVRVIGAASPEDAQWVPHADSVPRRWSTPFDGP